MGKINLSSKEERLFMKYAIYNGNEEQLSRQKYMYQKVLECSDKVEEVKELLNLTNEEIDRQYRRKEFFETKAGFLLAFWGIIAGIFVKSELFISYKMKIGNFFCLVSNVWVIDFLIVLISGVLSLIYILKVLYAQEYRWYAFGDRKNNAEVLMKDKGLAYITILEGYTDSWQFNNKQIEIKSGNFCKAIKWTAIFVVSTFISLLY